MKVILVKNVPKLGKVGDIKDVPPAYARNVLLKSRLVTLATSDNIKRLASQKIKINKERVQKQSDLKKIAQQLNSEKIIIKEKTNEQGKLFAGIDAKRISTAISKRGLELTASALKLKRPIKEIGEYDIAFSLSSDLNGQFKLEVKAS